MNQLTSEHRNFLMEQVRTAKLATVRKDGRPHVTPIWFVLDGDTLVFTTWHTSIKALNIRRDGRVYLCVDDEKPPFSYIQIEGTAIMSADSDALEYWSTRIAVSFNRRFCKCEEAWFCSGLNVKEKGLAHFLGFRVIDRPDGEAWFCGEISRRVEMVA